MLRCVIVSVACLILLAPIPARGQLVITGSIEGTVRDDSNAAIPGVTVCFPPWPAWRSFAR